MVQLNTGNIPLEHRQLNALWLEAVSQKFADKNDFPPQEVNRKEKIFEIRNRLRRISDPERRSSDQRGQWFSVAIATFVTWARAKSIRFRIKARNDNFRQMASPSRPASFITNLKSTSACM